MVRSMAGGSRLSASQEPRSPPIAAASIQSGNCGGRPGSVAQAPVRAAAEFRRLKFAEIAAACRVVAQLSEMISGATNIPPPIPVMPEMKPMMPPAASDGS